MSDVRAGLGFDVHPRDASRALWLGGVRFDGEAGLAGHSDGDAVCTRSPMPCWGGGLGSVGHSRTDRRSGIRLELWVVSRWSPTQVTPDFATPPSGEPRSLRDATRCVPPSRGS